MSLANQKQLNDQYQEMRHEFGIPDDLTDEDFIPEKFGPCFFCKKWVSDFDFCWGCDCFVCQKCNDPNKILHEQHKVEDHLTL